MTVKDFINQVFLNEYKRIAAEFHYISFALIALGIEFLGACLDSHDFARTGRSKARFVLAIKELFPQTYHQYATALYEELRSGFAHQFRPGRTFGLTHRQESAKEGTQHLAPFAPWATILVAEDFYADFEAAFHKVVEKIDNGSLTGPKFSQFLKIT